MPEAGTEARIAVADGSPDDLGSLYRWLRNEDGTEEMGTAQDAIAVAMGSGGAFTILATALPVWLRQRRGSQIKLEVTVPAWGLRLVIEADKAEDADRLLRQVLNAHPQGR
jgi:acetyl esterase/lipase